MEYFSLCSAIYQEEKAKCNLDFKEIVRKISEFKIYNNLFESPYDRFAYLYKTAPCMISFVKDCIDKFLNDCPVTKDAVLKWKSQQNLNFCSFSSGPALDYLSFCLALSECVEVNFTPSFGSLRVISVSAQWKHSLQSLIDSLKIGYIKSFPPSSLPNTFIVNHNPKMLFNNKQIVLVQDADVVFMMKTLSLTRPDEFEERRNYFQNIIAAMKMGSYLFCIDTKPSVSVMFEILKQVPGKLIYGPVFNIFQLPEKFPESLIEVFGCLPTMMARGSFFVWEKTTLNLPVPGSLLTTFCEVPQTSSTALSNNAQPSSFETTLHLDIAENIDKDCNNEREDQRKSEAGIIKEKEIRDRIDASNLPSQLFTLYNLYSSGKSAKDLKNNGNEKFFNSLTSEEIIPTIELEVTSILSDICDTIDYDQVSGKVHPAPVLDKSVSNVFVTKNELSPETTCSSNMLSFDAFLKEIGDNNKTLFVGNESKSNGKLAEVNKNYEFVVTSNDVKSQSVLEDLSNITDHPSIRSPIEPNEDSTSATLHPFISPIEPKRVMSNAAFHPSVISPIELSKDLTNAINHPSIRSPIEPNGHLTVAPIPRSTIEVNRDSTNVTLHSSIRSPVEPNGDLSNDTFHPFIRNPIKDLLLTENFVKFPVNQSLSAEFVSAELPSSQIIEKTNSNFQNQQVKSDTEQTCESLSNVIAFSDPLISLKKRRCRAKKLLNAPPHSSITNNSNTPINIPLYSSMCGASSSYTNATPNSSLCFNTNVKTDDLSITGKEKMNRNKSSCPLKNESFQIPHVVDEKTLTTNPSINKIVSSSQSPLKLHKNEKFERTYLDSHTSWKSVSTNTNLESSYETNSTAIQQLTNKIKSLISGFDQITSQNENNTFRGKEAKPFHSYPSETKSCKKLLIVILITSISLTRNQILQYLPYQVVFVVHVKMWNMRIQIQN